MKSAKLSSEMLSEHSDTLNAGINTGDAPPVDESLYFENMEVCRLVKINGETLTNKIYLAFNPKQRKILKDMEQGIFTESPDGQLFPDFDEKFRNMAFLWSCFRGLVHLLPRFEESGVDIHWVAPITGVNAASASCFANSFLCLEYLIKKGINVNHINPKSHNSCLHAAAIGNARECAELLLNNGGKVNLPTNEFVEPVLHCAIRNQSDSVVELLIERGADVSQRNYFNETPLHVACAVQSVPCAKMLLEKSVVELTAVEEKNRTPLHFAVMSTRSSVELVELLIEKGANINASDNSGFTALHIAALNEQSQCVESLIWAGADLSATNNKSVSALSIILKKIPEAMVVFRKRLDESIKLKRPSQKDREFELKLELNILFPSNNPCETSLINMFIQEGQREILSHPLVKAFLHLKWEKIRRFQLIRIILYLLAIIFMSIYTLTALACNCYNISEKSNNSVCTSDHISGYLYQREIIQVEWYLSISLMSVLMPRRILGYTLHKTAKMYFFNTENVLDILVIIMNFIISFIYTDKTYEWQKYFGAFAVLGAWTNMMFMLGQLPSFGTYVAMFIHIQAEFAKLLLAYSSLLIGFTISFCVLFITEESFSNPFTGIIKVLSMMAGDLDFENLLKNIDALKNESFDAYDPLSICSQILFSLFVIFITIILMNLLVGIAVHDIQGLRTHAALTKLARQSERAYFTELELSNKNLPAFVRATIPNHNIGDQDKTRVITVKPLNHLEKRLPKDILTAAYEIALKNPPISDEDNLNVRQKFSCFNNKKEKKTSEEFQDSLEKLITQLKDYESEVRFLKNKINDIQDMLKKILR